MITSDHVATRHGGYPATGRGVPPLGKAQEPAQRIRADALTPGAIRAPRNHAARETGAALGHLLPLMSHSRIGGPGNTAQALTWLTSDPAGSVNHATPFAERGMRPYSGFRDGG